MNSFFNTALGLIAALIVAGCASEPTTAAPASATAPASITVSPSTVAPAASAQTTAAAAPKKINFTSQVYFDANKSKLGKQAKHELDALIEKLKVMKKVEVIIATGHTGKGGTAATKVKQGMERAEAVKKYLMVKGVPANKIYTDSKADTQLVSEGQSEEERNKNRRVEIEVVGFSVN